MIQKFTCPRCASTVSAEVPAGATVEHGCPAVGDSYMAEWHIIGGS